MVGRWCPSYSIRFWLVLFHRNQQKLIIIFAAKVVLRTPVTKSPCCLCMAHDSATENAVYSWILLVLCLLFIVALHAEPLNESSILVTWAAKGTPPYTVHYWLSDEVGGLADAMTVIRWVCCCSNLIGLFITVHAGIDGLIMWCFL